MILHIVNKSPFEHASLQQCLRCMGEKDSLILIEDGTFLFSNPAAFENLPKSDRLFILGDDATSRGIALDTAPVTIVDYEQFVELVARHAKSLSWF